MASSSNKKQAKAPSSANKMPAHWDNTLSDLTELRASPAEIARRRSSHMSKNQLAAKIELQRRALNSVVKGSKKPLPAVFVREVLPKPESSICSEVTNLSPHTLTICADRILERSARITAPSSVSSGDLHNVNPTITKRSGSALKHNSLNGSQSEEEDCESMLPVQVTPMLKSRLDRLAEAVTAPVALNEQSTSEISGDKKSSSMASLSDGKASKISNKATSSDNGVGNSQKEPASAPSNFDTNSVSTDVKASEKKSTSSGRSRLPETIAILEQLFSALQIEAAEADLIPKPDNGEGSDSTGSSHPSLTGHTAMLVRVLLGLVSRVRQLESHVAALTSQVNDNHAGPVSAVNALSEKVFDCERKVDNFHEELRVMSIATSESLQRIHSELENIATKPPVTNECPRKSLPVEVHNVDDIDFDDFDSDPWLNPAAPPQQEAENVECCENAEPSMPTFTGKGNIENAARAPSTSPPPSSIPFCASGNSSLMFGDRLGSQLAELTRQHEQARARLQVMQRSVKTMGRFTPFTGQP